MSTAPQTIVVYRKEREGTVHQSPMFSTEGPVNTFRWLARSYRQTTVLYLVRCRPKSGENPPTGRNETAESVAVSPGP